MGAGQGRSGDRVTYRVDLAPPASRQLRKLDGAARRRIQAAIELLADEPHPPAAKKLVGGDGEWRVRTGDYRVINDIDDGVLVVLVLAIGHRREVTHVVDSPPGKGRRRQLPSAASQRRALR